MTKRKLNSLAIKDPLQREFLDDIFGNDEGKEKGLVDADSNADFDVQLESLYPVWNECEKVARKLSGDDEPIYCKRHEACDVEASQKIRWSGRRILF